jgi:hypothetical protein
MTPIQEEALRDYLQEAIVPLIEQVLVKKLGQAMTFAAEQLVQPKREWVGLTDEERNHARHTVTYSQLAMTAGEWAEAVQIETEKRLKEKNTL